MKYVLVSGGVISGVGKGIIGRPSPLSLLLLCASVLMLMCQSFLVRTPAEDRWPSSHRFVSPPLRVSYPALLISSYLAIKIDPYIKYVNLRRRIVGDSEPFHPSNPQDKHANTWPVSTVYHELH